MKIRRRAWRGPRGAARAGAVDEPRARAGARTPSRRRSSRRSARGSSSALTERQRTVLVALALNGVPIDVLAEREGTTRGALYKTLHDARKKLRAYVEEEMG